MHHTQTKKRPFYAPVVSLRMVRERKIEMCRHITKPEDVVAFLSDEFGTYDRETLVVVLLCSKNRVQAVHQVAIGVIDGITVTLREIFKAAVVGNAASIILAHNHPSGDPTPSPEDIALTQQARQAGDLLDIDVLDHIVLGEPPMFYSMRQKQLWPERLRKP